MLFSEVKKSIFQKINWNYQKKYFSFRNLIKNIQKSYRNTWKNWYVIYGLIYVENLLWRWMGSTLLQIRIAFGVSPCLLLLILLTFLDACSYFEIKLHAAATVIGRLHLVKLPRFGVDLANLLNIFSSFLFYCI